MSLSYWIFSVSATELGGTEIYNCFKFQPTRIPSPDSLAVKRVGTTQGERKPLNNLKASFSSSSPEEKDRSKRTGKCLFHISLRECFKWTHHLLNRLVIALFEQLRASNFLTNEYLNPKEIFQGLIDILAAMARWNRLNSW